MTSDHEANRPGPAKRRDVLPQREAELRREFERQPEAVGPVLELADLLVGLGRREEALNLYRQVVNAVEAGTQQQSRAHVQLASQLTLLGRDQEAAEHGATAQRLGGALPTERADLGVQGTTPEQLTQVSPAVRVDAGGAAQATETAVAGPPGALVAAWNDQRDGTVSGVWRLGTAWSDDGGESWTESLIRPPFAGADDYEGDPIAAYDPRTGDAWVGGVSFYQGGSIFVARRRAGQNSFSAPVVASKEPDGFYDKPLLVAGRGPSDPDSTRLYITYSGGLIWSDDLGRTWSPTVPLFPSEIYYQPRIGPDGTLWILSWDHDAGIWLRRSTDGGSTVGARTSVVTRMDAWLASDASRVPGSQRIPPLPSLAVGRDGTLYVVYCDTSSVTDGETDLDLFLTTSGNRGQTWTAPVLVNQDAPSSPALPGDQFAPWLEIDENGRLHLVFMDTRYHAQSDEDFEALIDVTYSFSDDGGVTWHETRVTGSSTSSTAAVWQGGPLVDDYQFIGDYIGLTVSDPKRPVVVYSAQSGNDLDIFSRSLEPPIFIDGFESGTLDAWSP